MRTTIEQVREDRERREAAAKAAEAAAEAADAAYAAARASRAAAEAAYAAEAAAAKAAAAKDRAETLAPGLDIYADGNNVCEAGVALIGCESHWDACLVLLAYGKQA